MMRARVIAALLLVGGCANEDGPIVDERGTEPEPAPVEAPAEPAAVEAPAGEALARPESSPRVTAPGTPARKTAARETSGTPSSRAVYAVSDDGSHPRLHRLRVERPTPFRDEDGVWPRLRMEARDEKGRVLAFEVTTTSRDRPSGEKASSWIRRYALAVGDEAPREFIDSRTGEVLLPALPATAWFPRAAGDEGANEWFERGTFLGRELRRVDEPSAEIAWPEGGVERVVLDRDVMIATSRDFRDDGTGRQDDDWNWIPLEPRDYRRMIDAGFNLFRVRSRDLPMVLPEPVFVVTSEGFAEHPELAMLPTYAGAVMYADEPASRARGDDAFREIGDPERVASDVAARTRRLLAGDDHYGRGFLATRLRGENVAWGSVPVLPYPVWEAVPSAAWYELEAGADAWCFESRLDPDTFSANVKRTLGVDFPARAEACADFHLALFRGAARHFDAPWGVAIYGQTAPAAAEVLLHRAHDAGATYFWFWTSDRDHHVPHARQLELARSIRDYARRRPRPEGAAARTGAARIALVLPWGYTLDDDTVKPRPGGACLWGVPGVRLDDAASGGVSHRDVLAAAMRAAVRLIERGEAWDLLYLRDDETASGYDEILRVTRTGEWTESHP